MAQSNIQDQPTEKIVKALGTIRWLLPLLVSASVFCIGVLIYLLIVGYSDNTSLLFSTAFCIIMAVYFYSQKKKLKAELTRRENQ